MNNTQTDYWHALDKTVAEKMQVNPQILGISHGIGDVAKGLKANIFAGAKVVELGFMGVGKGSRSTPTGVTPELFGKTEREDMRNMAKINDVVVTTHATANVQGFAGLDPQKGGFKAEKREEALHEIQRAVDFAADVAQGGPVVIHAGEFPRPIYKADKNFQAYEEEPERAPVYLVDKVTGKIIPVERDKKIPFAIRDPDTKEYKRDKKGELEIKMKDYTEIEKEFYKLKKDKRAKFDNKPEKYFFNEMSEERVNTNRAQAMHFDSMAKDSKRKLEPFQAAEKVYDDFKGRGTEEQLLNALMTSHPDISQGIQRLSPEQKTKLVKEGPGEFFKNQINEIKGFETYYEGGAVGYKQMAQSAEEEIKNIMPIQDYAIKKSTDTIARAAITAYDRERSQKLKKPLFIAPENIFPESYGAHPSELKDLITQSRTVMSQKLKDERGITKSEADKIAADHIKATFDIGHAYTWKKYFKKERPDEPPAVTEKRFRTWMDQQVDKLQKEGIIGHVHLSDNFGYYDEHVTPGEGTAPIKEFVDKLKKDKFKGVMVVEPGAQPEGQIFEALKGAWRTLSSPVYRLDTMGLAWTDVQGSYFGRTGSPTYVVGDYAPSKDWTLWSGAPLE